MGEETTNLESGLLNTDELEGIVILLVALHDAWFLDAEQ